MSSNRTGFRCARQLIGVLALSLAFVCGVMPAFAASPHSSPEDRERFVSITRSMEEAPLKPSLQPDRQWALIWLTRAPDVTVHVCLDMLGGMERDYANAPAIVVQYMFSMAAFVIEKPEAVSDWNAQQLAGVEGALSAYRSILRDNPEAKSPGLEALLEAQGRGELPDFIRRRSAACSAKK
jgi:hypothetical protein